MTNPGEGRDVAKSSNSAGRKEPYQILLVEDTLDEALMVRTVLEAAIPCKVTLAQDGIRGCQLAENQDWDLIVTDLNLPGRDGMEVIQISKEKHPEAPVIATTAYSGPHWVDQAFRVGADEVLPKPLDKDELLSTLKRFIEEIGPEEPAPSKTVLAVGALPGDVEVGCGGMLLGHIARGDRVVIVLFTAGKDEEDAASGLAASKEAAAIMGGEIVVAEPSGSAVPDIDDLIDFLSGVVEEEEPQVLYVPSRNDVRESRQNAYRAVAMGASEVPNIYCYQAATTTLDFRPTIFQDVKEYMDQKMVVLSAFEEQAEGRPHLRPEMARATAMYWGRFLGYGEVEPMEVRQTQE